ncbi:MAG: hypothetical protein AAF225_12660, partial [Pseudomonadota bacterium]
AAAEQLFCAKLKEMALNEDLVGDLMFVAAQSPARTRSALVGWAAATTLGPLSRHLALRF